MRLKSHSCLACCFLLAAAVAAHAELPAFPGAEGFGAHATGGRGGDVYYVSNLGASGAGSFAYGVQNAPPEGRTILFKVSGHIRLPSGSGGGLTLSKSKITVAGQTAPGDGICFWNNTMNLTGNDLVFRDVRWRYGYSAAGGDSVDISASQRIIFDHCDVMFSTDENLSSFGTAPEHMTFQWSVNAWGLSGHSCGGLWKMRHATVHNTLWANNHTRNPKLIGCDVFDWVNNLTFGWDLGFNLAPESYETGAVYRVNIRNSSFVHGGSASSAIYGGGTNVAGEILFRLHMADSALDGNNNGVLDVSRSNYSLVEGGVLYAQVPSAWPQTTNGEAANPVVGVPVAVAPRMTAYKKILSQVGAVRMEISTRPLRDEITALCVARAAALQRGIISDPLELNLSTGSAFAPLQSETAPFDTDLDGMPDDWESSVGYDPATADNNVVLSAPALAASFFPVGSPVGYTRLEEYLHFKAVPHGVVAKNTADSPSFIDIDLRRFTSGFTDSPVFTLSSVTGGTASSSGPGNAVVRFTPAQNTSGRAGFLFTVTDADCDTWTQPCCLLVATQPQPRPVTWVGDGSGNAWNFTATNFASLLGPVAFTNGDAVTVDDTGSASPALTVAGTLVPASLTVDNSAKAFTIGGSGSLGGSGGLTKLGSGRLTLGVNHSGTGAGLIDGGTVVLGGLSNVGTLPSGPLTLQGGAVISNAWPSSASTQNIAAPLYIPEGQAATIYTGRRVQLSGSVTGGGDLTIVHQGIDGTVQFRGAMNTFAGSLNLLFAGSNGALATVFNGGAFNGWGAARVILGTGISVNPTTNSGGNTFPIGELSGTGTLGGGSAGAPNYTLGGLNTDMTFGGVFSGNAKVTKTGSGTLTLAGASTHTGATAINSGTLAFTGSFGASPVSVAANAVLAGTGTFGGSLTVAAGGLVSPGANGGASAGTLTAAALSMTAPSLRFDLSATPGGTNDRIQIAASGAIALTGVQTFGFTFTDGLLGAGIYDLISTAGALVTTNVAWVSNLPAGTRQTLSLTNSPVGATPGFVRLDVSGAPGNLLWTGANGARWDVQTTAAWSGATPATFYAFDTVRFDDTASVGSLTIAEPVAPQRITVSNTVARAYTFTGGPITGEGMLVKQGAGTLTLYVPQYVLATSITSNSPAATVASTNGLVRGMTVIGTGIPAATTIAALANATTLTFSTNATATSAAASLTYETRNTYSGGTVLNAGTLVLACNNWQYYSSSTPPPANPFGLGSGPITLNGGTLTLLGNTGNAQHLYGALPNDLIVPAGKSATLQTTLRGTSFNDFAGLRGSLTGSGVLNLVVNFKYGVITGDWSAFAGELNVTRPSSDANDPRFQLGNALGLPLAAVSLEQVQLEYCATLPVDGVTLPIGNLSGIATAVISGGQCGTAPVTWRVGGLNASATFAGSFTPYSAGGPIGLSKAGTGTWTLTGSGAVNAGLTVECGTLSYGDAATDSLGGVGPLTVRSDATLQLNSGATLTGGSCDVLVGGTFRGRGTLAADLSCGGTFAVTGGTLAVSGEAYLGGVISFSALTDRLDVAGNLGLEGRIDLPSTGLSYGRKPLLTYAGTLTLGAVTFGALPLGYLALLDTGTPGEIAVRLENLTAYQTWQTANFGNTTDPAGLPTADPDGDGMLNYEEYEAGTHPQSAASALPLVWLGGGANPWDQALTATWQENGAPRVFRDRRQVIINDAGTNTPALDLRGSLQPGSLVVTNTAKAFTLGGVGSLDGPMTLTKAGSGTLAVVTENGYTGATVIAAGVLAIQSDCALGSNRGGTVVSNNARLELQGGLTVSGEALSLAGPGGASFYTGALNSKSGSNVWSGPLMITAPGTRIGAQAGATLTVTGCIGSGGLANGLTVRPADATAVVVLSGTNSYLGDTAVFGGPLRLAGGHDRLPTGTTLRLGSGGVSGVVDLNGWSQRVAGVTLVSGSANRVTNSSTTASVLTIASATTATNAVPLGGNLALIKASSGTLTLTAPCCYTGGTAVDAGVLALSSAGSLGAGPLTVAAGATCSLQNVAGAIADTAAVYLNGSGTVIVAAGVAETVRRLYVEGVMQPAGAWDAGRDPLHFSGAGQMIVSEGVPAAPSNLTATAGDTQVGLSWSEVSNATGYVVRRVTMPGSDYQTNAAPAETAWTDSSVVNGTTYAYVVAATNALGTGAASALASATPQVPAFDGVWTNMTGGVWSAPGNWLNATVARGANRTATFSASAAVAVTQDLTSCFIGRLVFTNANHMLHGGALTLDAGIAKPTIEVAASRTATVVANLSGTNGFAKSGPGTLLLSGAKGYTGGTLLQSGELQLASGATAGTSPVTFEGGTLRMNGGNDDYLSLNNALVVPAGRTATLLLSPRVEVNGTLTGATNSTLNLGVKYVRDNFNANWSGFSGLLTLSGTSAEFRINNTNGLPNARLAIGTGVTAYQVIAPSGTATVQALGELSGAAGSFLGGNPTAGKFVDWRVGGLNTDSAFAGVIKNGTGAARLTKVGTGTLTLTGANTYTGETVVVAGTLKVGAAGALPAASALTLSPGSTLDLGGFAASAASLAGSGTLKVSAAGTLALSGTLTADLYIAVNPTGLHAGQTYAVVTCANRPPGTYGCNLRFPWALKAVNGALLLYASNGTVLMAN